MSHGLRRPVPGATAASTSCQPTAPSSSPCSPSRLPWTSMSPFSQKERCLWRPPAPPSGRWEHRHQTKRRRKRPRWRLRRPPRAADLGRVGSILVFAHRDPFRCDGSVSVIFKRIGLEGVGRIMILESRCLRRRPCVTPPDFGLPLRTLRPGFRQCCIDNGSRLARLRL